MRNSISHFAQSVTLLSAHQQKKLRGGNNSGPISDPDDQGEIVTTDSDIL